MAPAYFASPFFLLVAILIAIVSVQYFSEDAKAPYLSAKRLYLGLLVVALLCAVFAGVTSYLPLQEAAVKFKVAPEEYWSTLLNTWAVYFFLFAPFVLGCVAMIGIPVVVALEKLRLVSIVNVLVATVPISLLGIALITSIDTPPFRNYWILAGYGCLAHLLLALAFVLGTGMPWKSRAPLLPFFGARGN